ncbi:MAG: helix-turn-helix transcriptional regulator [Bacteroidetes bacterium]|nr:helix-turn-helix transcriptional regulator [Bacteroidota bacterium]
MAKNLNKIAQVLKKMGISQYRLAKESGVDYSLINAYHSNKRQPSLDTLEKIAKTLGVKGCDLLNF